MSNPPVHSRPSNGGGNRSAPRKFGTNLGSKLNQAHVYVDKRKLCLHCKRPINSLAKTPRSGWLRANTPPSERVSLKHGWLHEKCEAETTRDLKNLSALMLVQLGHGHDKALHDTQEAYGRVWTHLGESEPGVPLEALVIAADYDDPDDMSGRG